MNVARFAAWLLGAAVCGAWLASAAGISRYTPVSRPPQLASPDVELNELAADVQAQASRLRARLTNAPAPSPLARNPFRFEAPQRPSRQVAPSAPHPTIPEPEMASVPEAALTLIGMAEQNGTEGLTRTAMIANGRDALIMAVAGDRILGRYEVVTVGVDAVELRDLLTGSSRRLVLR